MVAQKGIGRRLRSAAVGKLLYNGARDAYAAKSFQLNALTEPRGRTLDPTTDVTSFMTLPGAVTSNNGTNAHALGALGLRAPVSGDDPRYELSAIQPQGRFSALTTVPCTAQYDGTRPENGFRRPQVNLEERKI